MPLTPFQRGVAQILARQRNPESHVVVTSMGTVVVPVTVENLEDLFNVEKGLLAPDQVRRVEVADALVDTGAAGLLLPKRLIATLGLHPLRTRQARGLGGTVLLPRYRAVRLTIQGRDCVTDVGEVGGERVVKDQHW